MADEIPNSNPESAAEPQPVESTAAPTAAARPGVKYDTLGRPHDEHGKLLPRSEAPKAPGSEGGGPALLSPAPRPANKKSIRVKQGKKAVQPERTAQARARREVQNQAKETCRAITQMMITAVKVSLGEECEPSPALRQRIEEPGARILERMNPETSEMIAKYADPMQLTMALAEWGAQILRVVQERQKQKAMQEPPAGEPMDEPTKNYEPGLKISPDGNNGHHEAEPVIVDSEPYHVVDRTVSPDELDAQMGLS